MYYKIKNFSIILVTLVAFTIGGASTANATEPGKRLSDLTEREIAISMEIMSKRVEEIKNMDRKSLTKQERKELRKELREMNKTAKAMGQGGVYLSVGAIIIIILLLILIL